MTGRKEKALQAVLVSSTRTEAARAAGISERTLRSYFDDGEFYAQYRERVAEALEEATRTAQRNMSQAVDVLLEVATNPAESGSARTAAAKATIEAGLKLSEFVDVLRRLDALEQRTDHDSG